MEFARRLRKDHFGGLLLLAAGLGTLAAGLGYGLGTLRQPDTGFFPALLGAVLALAGLALLATTPLAPRAHPPDPAEASRSPWRSSSCPAAADSRLH